MSSRRAYVKAIQRARRRALCPRVPRYGLSMGKPYSDVIVARGPITPERKYYQVYVSDRALTAPADWTGTEHDPVGIGCLFAPALGNTIITRIGRRVDVFNIKMRGSLTIPGASAAANPPVACTARVILYVDKQSNAVQSQGEQVMAATGGTAADNIHSFRSLQNLGRFQVLADQTYSLSDYNFIWDSAGASYDNAGFRQNFKISYKFKKPLRVVFNGNNAGDYTDIEAGSLHVIAACDAIANNPRIAYSCRTSFVDV